MTMKVPCFIFAVIGVATSSSAEPVSLPGYLQRLDKAEVTLNGHIRYDDGGLGDYDFVFYDEDGVGFPVTIDADRKSREQIEAECAHSHFILRLIDLCRIEGLGTIDLQGNRIHLNIDVINDLSRPAN